MTKKIVYVRRGGGGAAGLAASSSAACPASGRRPPDPYLAALGSRVVVLDRSRAVILVLQAAGLPGYWAEFYARTAAEFTWPGGTVVEAGQDGNWTVSWGRPGCRWSSRFLPDAHEMVIRAAGGR